MRPVPSVLLGAYPTWPRSCHRAPSCGQSRAITRGQPWIEMCLCTGTNLSLVSYQAGLETFRRGMCSGPLKPAQCGLPILIMPKLGRCLCREAPVFLHEPPRPLSSLHAFLLLCLQAAAGSSLASLPFQPVPLGKSCNGCSGWQRPSSDKCRDRIR